jgi:hypothetical protein
MSVPGGPDPDVLEFGGSGPDRPRPRWQRLAWLPLGLVAVLVGVFVVNAQHQRNVATGPSPTPAASSRPPAGPSSGADARPSPSGSAPSTTDLGHPLFETVAGWELIGRGPTGVVRIDPAHGRIATTPVPAIGSNAPTFLVAGRDWVMVRSTDSLPGYLVPDGQPARELTGPLDQAGPLLPGPDGNSAWVEVMDSPGGTMTLVGADGRPIGPRVAIPLDAFQDVRADGAGYVVFNGIGGTYSARPDAIRRITAGRLLAAGPTRWVVVECDDQHHCATVAIDRSTGARHTLSGNDPVTSGSLLGGALGAVSPDGAKVALALQSTQAPPALHVIDLNSGADQTFIVPGPVFNEGTDVWSPDGAWLIAAGSDGTLYLFSASTGRVVNLDGIGLPAVTQLTVRFTAPAG